MKKTFLLLLSLFIPAGGVFASGIDWEKSIMMVEFTEENTFVPEFSCFGYTDRHDASGNPGDPGGQLTACLSYAGPQNHCVWEYLSELGYDDENSDPDITDCFQQAGDYKVSIYLKDFAGNVEGPDINQFDIKAGPPDPETSEFALDATCDDLSITANGEDVCSATLKIKDEFGNPVTQLKGETGYLYSDGTFENDANKGDRGFRTGMRVKDSIGSTYTDVPTSTAPRFNFTIGNDDEVTAALDFIAWAPSIQKHGPYLGKNIPFNFPLVLETPTVDESGVLDTGSLITYEYGDYTPAIGFGPWVRTALDVLAVPPNFLLDTPVPMDLIRNIVIPLTGGPNDLVSIFVMHHNLNDGLYFDGMVFDPSSIDTTAQNTRVEPELKASNQDVVTAGTVAFSTDIAYEVDVNGDLTNDTLIRYPSGALGSGIEGGEGADDYDDETIVTGSVGASVEGKLIGAKDKGVMQDYNAVRLGDIDSVDDIREEVFANAYRITRSIEARPQTNDEVIVFESNWFADADVVLVENADVVIGSSSGTLALPSGQKTLVMKNGNLIIAGDYTYSNALDSFGFILLNDEIEVKPATGNIFVKEDVKRMAGTIFAEGTMASISPLLSPINDGDVTTADISNRHESTNDIQLLFEGTLLTHNTLGGAILLELDTTYFTPWGDTPAAEESDRLEAIKYDLNYMRYYQPRYSGGVQTNTDDCVMTAGSCDQNVNAMIIRYDGKAATLSPPGFENASFFGR